MYKPNTVQFELVEGCNRTCSFCGTNGFERKAKFISPSVLKKQARLVEESGYKPRVALVGHGEPTMHPEFFKCVKLMRKVMPDLHFQMMTNGYLIRKDLNNIIKIFDAGVNDIILDEYSDNKFDFDIAAPDDKNTKTGLTAADVAQLANQAIDAAFNIRLKSLIVGAM